MKINNKALSIAAAAVLIIATSNTSDYSIDESMFNSSESYLKSYQLEVVLA